MEIEQFCVPLIIRETPPGVSDSGYVVGTIWIDKIHDNCYVCIDSTSGSAIWRQIGWRTTVLTVTGTIAAETSFSVEVSGVNYTKSGDSGYLLESAALFNETKEIQILFNGVIQKKGVEAVWLSNLSFKLSIICDPGDEIIILS